MENKVPKRKKGKINKKEIEFLLVIIGLIGNFILGGQGCVNLNMRSGRSMNLRPDGDVP